MYSMLNVIKKIKQRGEKIDSLARGGFRRVGRLSESLMKVREQAVWRMSVADFMGLQ